MVHSKSLSGIVREVLTQFAIQVWDGCTFVAVGPGGLDVLSLDDGMRFGIMGGETGGAETADWRDTGGRG